MLRTLQRIVRRRSAPVKRRPVIVITEDDAHLREAYRRRFTRTHFTVRFAENGLRAEALLRESPPDLLICDVMMPEKDGWWVLEQFPKASRAFPILMITNLDDAETAQRCKALGADGHLVKKNMSLASLVATAERLLRRPGAPGAA